MKNALYDKIVKFNIRDKKRNLFNFINYMYDKTAEMFEYEGLPDSVPSRVLERMLQFNGNVFWHEVNGTIYVFTGGKGGEPDVYYEPTIYTVANPALNYSKGLSIKDDGVLMRNDYLEMGLFPILAKYGTLLVESDLSFRLGLINTRATNVISAGDDKTKKSADSYMTQLENGETSIIGESQLLDGVRVQPFSQTNTNLTDLRETTQYLKASLYAELGLKMSHNMKREYINEAESAIDDDTLTPFVQNMLHCREEALVEVNQYFGTNITVRLKGAWDLQESELERAIEVATSTVTEEEIEDEKPTSGKEAEGAVSADGETQEDTEDIEVEETIDNVDETDDSGSEEVASTQEIDVEIEVEIEIEHEGEEDGTGERDSEEGGSGSSETEGAGGSTSGDGEIEMGERTERGEPTSTEGGDDEDGERETIIDEEDIKVNVRISVEEDEEDDADED